MTNTATVQTREADAPAPWQSKCASVEIPLSERDAGAMSGVVGAVQQVLQTPLWQQTVLASAKPIEKEPAQRISGLFAGFDFHLTPDGPRLIEINTNAGGAFYGALIENRRFRVGSTDAKPWEHWSSLFVQHVRSEWGLAGQGELRNVAIVDDTPGLQFLKFEFELAARMLKDAGINAMVADPAELSLRNGHLWCSQTRIDLVYNRLTSFTLDRTVDKPLHDALSAGAAVITPDPRTHALLACKKNLILLGNDDFLRDCGVSSTTRRVLSHAIPKTVAVDAENAPRLWEQRANFYFKPVNGFGSRGVYAGDKLTTKTWNEIATSGLYIAQARIDPPRTEVSGSPTMRYDIRNFVYSGDVFMRIARVYRGQTTNFRTPGGGFAPLVQSREA